MINLSVVSPAKTVLTIECAQLSIPTTTGVITVLPHHAPLFSVLNRGEIEVVDKNKTKTYLLISGGFVSVYKDTVTVLADYGDRSEELDEAKILAAKKRAEDDLKLEKMSAEQRAKLRADLLHNALQLEYLGKKRHRNPARPGVPE